jgi:hypothetical protein
MFIFPMVPDCSGIIASNLNNDFTPDLSRIEQLCTLSYRIATLIPERDRVALLDRCLPEHQGRKCDNECYVYQLLPYVSQLAA